MDKQLLFTKLKIIVLSSVFVFLCSCCERDNGNGLDYSTPYAKVPAPTEVVMYEVNPRVFAKNNSLNAVTARLDEIKALGVNVIWLMPIYEQGILNAKDANGGGSPYCIKDYKKIDPEYGTPDDLRQLVAQAHKRGMSVILDWVANHTSWDNAWITEHPEWYTHDANGNIIHPAGTDWTDVADLNFGTKDEPNTELYNAFFDAMKYWFTAANIDGFRCDAVNYVPAEFLQQMTAELRAFTAGRRVLLLAEGDNKNFYNLGFDMDYGWSFYNRLTNLFNNAAYSNRTFFNAYKNEWNKVIPEGKSRLYFTTNHDKSAWEKTDVQLFGGNRGAMSAFVITVTLSKTPLIYSTQEIGRQAKVPFFSYTAIDWSQNPDILAEYKQIMKIYTSSDIFRTGTLTTFDDVADVVLYSYTADNEEVLVVANKKKEPVTFAVPEQFVGKKMKDLMDNSSLTLSETVEMQPYQYYILESGK